MRRTLMAVITLVTLGAACSTSGDGETTADRAATTTSAAERRGGASETTAPPSPNAASTFQGNAVEGTVVRFDTAGAQVEVTITQDNPTVQAPPAPAGVLRAVRLELMRSAVG